MAPTSTSSQLETVYAFGSNGSGQLGIGHTEDTSTPQPVLRAPTLQENATIAIACGGNHSVLLLDGGHLAGTGGNDDGRCFAIAEQQTSNLSPSKFSLGAGRRNMRLVTATWSATIVVCDQGKVWTCGTGSCGEIGLGDEMSVAHEPSQIPNFPPDGTSVMKLAACMAHVVAVLSNGEVWGWGKGRKGQLGLPADNVWRPRRIEGIPFFVVDAVCGKDFTCLFGQSSTGKLVMLGPTGNDRFGVRSDCPESIPGWKQVAATWGSILVLSQSGKLIGWGRDDHGQLPLEDLPPFESFAAGSEHCLGLTQTGRVLAWGWGEHGNCGLPTDFNGDVKGRWNEIETPHQAVGVFAGCATSFVVTKAS